MITKYCPNCRDYDAPIKDGKCLNCVYEALKSLKEAWEYKLEEVDED
jgi:hypothetical protein